MLSVHLESGNVEIRDIAKPVPAPGFALIRLLVAGICNTDIELRRGYYGFTGVPGHEFVGEVVEASTKSLIGKRVVGEINLVCLTCEWCVNRIFNHCSNRTVLGIAGHPGAFAEFLTLPERNLHIVPDDMPDEVAVFVEPVAAACRVFNQVDFREGYPVAVLGDGKLGLLIAQVLKAKGLRVHLFGRHTAKLRIAEKAGVITRSADYAMPVAEFDWVVDATGSAEGLNIAAGMLRPKGVLIMKSTVNGNPPVNTAALIVKEIILVGSRCGPFEPALKMLSEGQVQVREMISGRLPLSEAPLAFEKAEQRGVLKLLLTKP